MSKTIFCISAFLFLFSLKNTPSVYAQASIGNWKPILLTSPDEVPLTLPNEAKKRSIEIAEAQKQIEISSLEQKSQIIFWQKNHIIRWNEWARELVAAHNVPPRCLPDSSGYPTPKREQAADIPRYPFANPPYASRVFAYMSVAQHDALLAAHFYQSKFQKSTPSVYPPDEAVIAGATAAILTYMFPAEADLIAQKVEFARLSTFSIGKYTPAEWTAGIELGKAIAQKVLVLAKSDGMEAAQGSTSQWQQVVNRRSEAGEMTWTSIQKPKRESIEPFFGNVKPWLVGDVAQFRPSPPPSVNSEELKQEVEFVKRYSRVPKKEQIDMVVRWSDAEFTHTPIGHWNLIACDLLLKEKSDNEQKVRTLAALNRALMDAAIVCWEAKTYYCYPRPSQVDKTLHLHLPLPNFPSYPSGHSTFSGAAATVLSFFFSNESKKLFEMAEEASISRVYAALHFKMDCEAGMIAGKKVGDLFVKEMK